VLLATRADAHKDQTVRTNDSRDAGTNAVVQICERRDVEVLNRPAAFADEMIVLVGERVVVPGSVSEIELHHPPLKREDMKVPVDCPQRHAGHGPSYFFMDPFRGRVRAGTSDDVVDAIPLLAMLGDSRLFWMWRIHDVPIYQIAPVVSIIQFVIRE